MCGRFTMSAPSSLLISYFGLVDMPELRPRYNIAPTQPAPVVLRAPEKNGDWIARSACTTKPQGEAREDTSERFPAPVFRQMRWGLIPSWADSPSVGARMINARAETAAQKPSFRAAYKRRRCLVAADGFYEWIRFGKGEKRPYYIRLKDETIFAFAGLWERWQGEDETVESCTILTTEANELMRPLHDRMPVILKPESFDTWLDPQIQTPDKLQPLLTPYPSEAMTKHPVGAYVNNAAHEGPQCVEPIDKN